MPRCQQSGLGAAMRCALSRIRLEFRSECYITLISNGRAESEGIIHCVKSGKWAGLGPDQDQIAG